MIKIGSSSKESDLWVLARATEIVVKAQWPKTLWTEGLLGRRMRWSKL